MIHQYLPHCDINIKLRHQVLLAMTHPKFVLSLNHGIAYYLIQGVEDIIQYYLN